MKLSNKAPQNSRGFTLLELVIVIAILAIIGGAALVSYNGLDKRAAKGQATFNLAAIDKGVRLSKSVTGNYPNELDSVVLSDTTIPAHATTTSITATAGGFLSRVPRQIEGTDANKASSDGLFHFFPLTAEVVNAFNEAGITSVRGIADASDTAAISIANRAFDPAPNGVGTSVTLANGVVLPIVKSKNLGDTTSNDLQAITGLDASTTHVVFALGLGNNSSIVSDDIGTSSANFAEAPFYSDIASTEYGRFYLLFHVASDTDADDAIAAGEVFSEARFVGVLDAEGNWLDQSSADAVGDKS